MSGWTAPLRLLAAVLPVALALPGAALAADRYASPAGSGAACTQQSPCGAVTAINGAAGGDTVFLAPGDYGSPAPIPDQLTDNGNRLTIVGQTVPGADLGSPPQRPVLHTAFASSANVTLSGNGTSITDVDIVSTGGTAALSLSGGPVTVDRVGVRAAAGEVACSAFSGNATITNSVCAAVDQASSFQQTVTLRNVTLAVTNPAGLAGGVVNSPTLVTATNTIFHGGAAANGRDIFVGTSAQLVVSNSNYDPAKVAVIGAALSNGGGNQSAQPVFVNEAAGDYRESPASPTVNAGLDSDVFGSFDLGNHPRILGGRVDIGAFELAPPPTVSTGPAVDVTEATARVIGLVDGRGSATTWQVRYTLADGSTVTTPAAAVAATSGAQLVSATLGGLSPSSAHRYRFIATNASGTVEGDELEFTTPAAPAPPGATPAAATPRPLLVFPAQGLRDALRKGVLVAAGCTGGCTVNVRLLVARRAIRKPRGAQRTSPVVVGRRTLRLREGDVRLVRVRINRTVRQRLRRARSLAVTVEGQVQGGGQPRRVKRLLRAGS